MTRRECGPIVVMLVLVLSGFGLGGMMVAPDTEGAEGVSDPEPVFVPEELDWDGSAALIASSTSSSSGQPLSTSKTMVVPRDEIVFFALDSDDHDSNLWMWDDAGNNFAYMHSKDNDDDVTWPTGVATGDIDGDSRDEIVCVATEDDNEDSEFFVLDDALNNFAEIKRHSPDDDADYMDVAVGDIDGDSIDEIILMGVDDGDGEDTNGWVLDDALAGYAALKRFYMHDDVTQPVSVATGDMDGDGIEEILVGGTEGDHEDSYFIVYDDANTGFTKLLEHTPDDNMDWVDVTTGDIDGDGLQELLIFGINDDGEDTMAHILDDANAGFATITSWDTDDGLVWPISVAAGDLDGDRVDEIVFFATDADNEDSEGYALDDGLHSFKQMHYFEEYDDADHVEVTIGDIDCDGKAEIVRLGTEDDGDDLEGEAYDDAAAGFASLKTWAADDNSEWAAVACGDFDGDGITLQYTDEHWVTTSDPRVLVVMAAPPCVDGISQKYSGSGTAYGTEVSQGSGSSVEIGTTSSVTFSFEAEDPFGIAKAHASTTISQEFAKTNTETSMTTWGTSYASSYPDDVVIYEATKYDNYKYEITSHPDPDLVGTNMTIDVPREMMIYKETIDYFNANNGDSYDIGSETFKHTPGKVWSYPTATDKMMTLNNYVGWESTPVAVGQGAGTNTVTLDLSTEETTEESLTMGVEMEAGASVGGVGFSASSGMFTTNTHSITVGESTIYQGTVGDIESTKEYEKYSYNFGMFVYNYRRSPSVAYQVINYWVQEYHGPIPDRSVQVDWDFNEGNGTTLEDDSSWQVDSEILGPIWDKGRTGKGLAFDGIDDHVRFSPLWTTVPDAITFEAWIKANETILATNGSVDHYVLYHGERGEFRIYLWNGTVRAGVKLADGQWYLAEAPYPGKGWHHIVGVWERNDSVRLYVDGRMANITSAAIEPLFDPGPQYQASLGAYNRGASFFNGTIDDVRVYDRALSDNAISSRYRDRDGDDDDDAPSKVILMIGIVVLLTAVLVIVRTRSNPKKSSGKKEETSKKSASKDVTGSKGSSEKKSSSKGGSKRK